MAISPTTSMGRVRRISNLLSSFQPLLAMDTAAGDDCTSSKRASPGTNGAGVYHLATGNGDVDGEFLKPRGRKGKRIITQHNDVSELSHLDAPEELFLEARVRRIDGLAAQGLRHGERLASRDLLATERLVRH